MFSEEWFRMSDSLQQISNVAFMENSLPGTNAQQMSQMGKKDQGTLWDQERDELAVRILLEEGKLNLLLRILQSYKELERTPAFDIELKSFLKCKNQFTLEQCLNKYKKYNNTRKFMESIQILDISMFCEYCAEILQEAHDSKTFYSPSDCEYSQWRLVIHYLCDVAEKMEEIDEDRIMSHVAQSDIIVLLVTQIHKHWYWYRNEDFIKIARFFHLSMGSESFGTQPERFVKFDDIKVKIGDFPILFLDGLLKTHIEKKFVFNLIDYINKCKRQLPASSFLTEKPPKPSPPPSESKS